jgi:glycerol-3-phosphate dehydrogenase (NAD(P)+)
MAKVLVLGSGMMGTAVTVPLTDNEHDIHLVGTHLDGHIIEEIHESRTHPKLRSAVPASVKPYPIAGLEEALRGVDLVFLGVNSLGVEWAAEVLGPLLTGDVPIVSLTKGLAGDGQNLFLLPDVLRNGLPAAYRAEVRMASIGGPSIAGELAARRPTGIVITGSDQTFLDDVANILRTSYYHVWTSTDVIGVEVSVALKNIYALGVGMVQGLLEKEGIEEGGDVMHNMAAAIFAQGLCEIAYLVDYIGGGARNIYGLPGAGDLYVTCMGGRNMRMGRMLGLGMRYEEAKTRHMADDTVEGAELAFAIGPTIRAMIERGDLEGAALPLLQTMIDIVCHDAPAVFPWESFFSRFAS